MNYLEIFIQVFSMFIAIIILDYIWLVKVNKNFIIKEFKSLIVVKNKSIQVNLKAGLLSWFIIVLSTFIFVVINANSYNQILIYGPLFGFFMYSIYDLTNLTFIKNYPIKFVYLDIFWGTILCTLLSLIGYFVGGLI